MESRKRRNRQRSPASRRTFARGRSPDPLYRTKYVANHFLLPGERLAPAVVKDFARNGAWTQERRVTIREAMLHNDVGGAHDPRDVTVATFAHKYATGRPITMLTAYDYPIARIIDATGVDGVLVGDSLGMVVLGHKDTLSVTLEDMLHHIRAVRRGVTRALLVGDMPFMSYHVSVEAAVRAAGRLVQEGGVDAVKLEGGGEVTDTIRAITRAGIPVQGHIGLTPQRVRAWGGWKVQARTGEAAASLLRDAQAVEEAGCFSVVVESVPGRVAAYITEAIGIPTIGIGAGSSTSGQVLVTNDLLGMYGDFQPKFVKRFADLGTTIETAITSYKEEVERREFPGA